uniref:PCI domain-containing protein n=1 Tax=Heterorhabditis bacteriophora TaxID=37862 RepID=A0A1I7WUY0_HETBA
MAPMADFMQTSEKMDIDEQINDEGKDAMKDLNITAIESGFLTFSMWDRSPRPIRRVLTSSPESELYVHLLVLLYLVDSSRLTSAKAAAEQLICRGTCYLNSRLRTATLRHHKESQATLIFTLLRCYLINRQYQSAAKLVSKVTFPEGANNNDLARFLYYQGRIKALQLDYVAAAGYFLQVCRLCQPILINLYIYIYIYIYILLLAVRLGDLAKFNSVLDQYGVTFEKDETLTLIVRLRQNVIKTAVKQISLAYSRITIKVCKYFQDIAKKLQMNSEIETEYMVAKAIADGSIDAVITCDTKDGDRFMRSSETADVYRTTEPQTHFDSRIRYCLELHNQAVKALRFPPKNKMEVESIEAQREREQQELEFAKEMADEDDDDF